MTWPRSWLLMKRILLFSLRQPMAEALCQGKTQSSSTPIHRRLDTGRSPILGGNTGGLGSLLSSTDDTPIVQAVPAIWRNLAEVLAKGRRFAEQRGIWS